jgi:hypothetical protein
MSYNLVIPFSLTEIAIICLIWYLSFVPSPYFVNIQNIMLYRIYKISRGLHVVLYVPKKKVLRIKFTLLDIRYQVKFPDFAPVSSPASLSRQTVDMLLCWW